MFLECVDSYKLVQDCICRFIAICNKQVIMNSKVNKKSQFDGVIQAIFQVIKLSVSLLAFVSVCIFIRNNILIVLALSILLYYLYLVIQSKSYVTLKKYYQRAKKYQTLHYLFEQHQKSTGRHSILPFFDDEMVERKKSYFKTGRESQEDEINSDNFSLHAVPIYVPKQTTKKQHFSRNTRDDSVVRTSQRLVEQFSKNQDMLFQICLKDFNKDIKREQLQYLAEKLSKKYSKKVWELLKLHENNMKQVKEEMEKNYQIKIYEGELLEKSHQLVNVSIDDVLERMSLFRERESFPWSEKNDKDQTAKNQHFYRVNSLFRQRKNIDYFLSPFYPLNHKLREEVVSNLRSYKLDSIITASSIINTVIQLYNDTLKSSNTKQSYFLIRDDQSTQSCIQFSSSLIDIYYHVDLVVKRKGKEDVKVKCPFGQQNLWIALAFAVHILQSKK